MGFQIFLTFFLVFLNGFFVAAEFAIVKVRASQIEIKVKTGNRIARIAKHITQHLDGYLAATQLGITLASLGLGWVGERVMEEVLHNLLLTFGASPETIVSFSGTAAPIIAFTLITIMHIVFGELAPKSFAIQRPVNTTLGIALPLHAFYLVFRPFIWLLNGFANLILKAFGIHTSAGHEAHHSSEELQYLLDQGKESGALDTNEHELIKNVFDFNERVVKNIMVPRTKISAIELETPTAEVLDYIIKEGYSRIPVFEDTIDKIVGIIHAKDVLPILVEQKEVLIADIIRKLLTEDLYLDTQNQDHPFHKYADPEMSRDDICEQLRDDCLARLNYESQYTRSFVRKFCSPNGIYRECLNDLLDDYNVFVQHCQ
jgi:CBS domain containing-hemolysin-like protein